MFIVIIIIVAVLVGGIMLYGAPNINNQEIKTDESTGPSPKPRVPFSTPVSSPMKKKRYYLEE
jgi:flagellar basal body-associated protein FliL